MRVTIRILSLTVAGLLTAALVVAAPVGKEAARKDTTAEALRKALDEPITLEVGDQPILSVITQLADAAKVSIVFDKTALQMIGMEPTEAVVSLRAKDMKLKTALRTVAGQQGLSFGIVGDHILVSTEETVCQRQLRQHISVDLEDVQFTKALKDLAKSTATNLVLDPRQAKLADTAKVSMKLDDVPLQTAVRLMAEMAGLKPARMGNVLFVTNDDRADKLKDADHATNPSWPPIIGGGIGGIGGGLMPAAPAAPAAPMVPPPPPPPKQDK